MSSAALHAHLAGGSTTVCRAWVVSRGDGLVLGFTDHDRDLVINGVTCRASAGLSARALQQTTGLSVDNSEAMGALSDASITEPDILAGRFDGAEVRTYLVNWAATEDWITEFRGNLGEISRSGGSFRAELRGLTEILNQPQGHSFQPRCSAVLGDARCRFATGTTGFFTERTLDEVVDGREFRFLAFPEYSDRWFENGRLEVITGEAAGLFGVVKIDRIADGGRRIELWQSVMADVKPGDLIRIIAGCDKEAVTCRRKFSNFLNFRGFPHIPGDDWLASYPGQDRLSGDGSRSAGTRS
jgi:uncharacterized phage protein (TIGR02218 family)